MADISLPLINIDKLQYHNFYNVCIKSIKKQNSLISNKSELIQKIERLRDKQTIKIKKKILPNFSNDETKRKKMKTNKTYKMPYNKKTLVKILSEYNNLKKESQKEGEKEKETKSKNSNNDNNDNNGKLNREKQKSDKKMNKNNEKKENEEVKKEINKETKKTPRNYGVLHKVLEYLESNNITLFEYIKKNQFQKKPYQISKSFEFINAVKFKNYDYVIEALQDNIDYLFSFDYFGQTCYHWAAKLSNIKMLEILFNFGKYLNLKDFNGRTPLYLAAINNDRKICEILLKNGANVHLKDNNGKTAADIAGSKELKYYLGDFMTQSYINLSCRQRVGDYLRLRKQEEEEKRKKEKENEDEEEENYDEE